MIESAEQFRRVLGDLIDDEAQKQQIYVFVDDLDRCLPDVALDLLEAIKIFLADHGCVFIIAVDVDVISKGLMVRLKIPISSTTFLPDEGRNYIDKLVQLEVRVRRASTSTALLLRNSRGGSQPPDLIQSAIGENPRRLKRYCNLLSYKYSVERTSDEHLEEVDGVNR